LRGHYSAARIFPRCFFFVRHYCARVALRAPSMDALLLFTGIASGRSPAQARGSASDPHSPRAGLLPPRRELVGARTCLTGTFLSLQRL
jgi:hypothetical protein